MIPLDKILNASGYEAVKEYRFHPTRRFRFDYALPNHKIAIEIEGGIWVQGRHTRGAGYKRDLEKYNLATTMGWRILRYIPNTPVKTIINDIDKIIGAQNGKNKKRTS